jgi:hypothetical protein
MADDKSKTGPADRTRVNVNEAYEVEYWSKKFGSTPAELKAAVKTAGVMAKDVEVQLKKNKG